MNLYVCKLNCLLYAYKGNKICFNQTRESMFTCSAVCWVWYSCCGNTVISVLTLSRGSVEIVYSTVVTGRTGGHLSGALGTIVACSTVAPSCASGCGSVGAPVTVVARGTEACGIGEPVGLTVHTSWNKQQRMFMI